jgi:transglutaminase-like putative cysteine protease
LCIADEVCPYRITGIHVFFLRKPGMTDPEPAHTAFSAHLRRQGVCQDFTHIMIALVRQLRIPCRYVSGYLYHRSNGPDRSAEDAMHAWVEAYLPGLGWVGFDPTNNVPTGDRHIRVAVGRDYADVPPTRGCSRGTVTASCAWQSRFTPRRRRRTSPA